MENTAFTDLCELFRFFCFCNCSGPSRFSCKSVNHACILEVALNSYLFFKKRFDNQMNLC